MPTICGYGWSVAKLIAFAIDQSSSNCYNHPSHQQTRNTPGQATRAEAKRCRGKGRQECQAVGAVGSRRIGAGPHGSFTSCTPMLLAPPAGHLSGKRAPSGMGRSNARYLHRLQSAEARSTGQRGEGQTPENRNGHAGWNTGKRALATGPLCKRCAQCLQSDSPPHQTGPSRGRQGQVAPDFPAARRRDLAPAEAVRIADPSPGASGQDHHITLLLHPRLTLCAGHWAAGCCDGDDNKRVRRPCLFRHHHESCRSVMRYRAGRYETQHPAPSLLDYLSPLPRGVSARHTAHKRTVIVCRKRCTGPQHRAVMVKPR